MLFLYLGDSTHRKSNDTTRSDADIKSGMEVYDLKKGESLFKLPLDLRPENFSFNGKTAVFNEGNNIKFVDLNTGKITDIFIDSGISNLIFSPDSQSLISESDGKIRVWRVPT